MLAFKFSNIYSLQKMVVFNNVGQNIELEISLADGQINFKVNNDFIEGDDVIDSSHAK